MAGSARPIDGTPAPGTPVPGPVGGGFVSRLMARARARAAAVVQERADRARLAVDATKPPIATPATASMNAAAAAGAAQKTRARAAAGTALGKPY